MQKLLIATKNKGKVAELGNFLSDLPIQLVSLKDVGIDADVVEDGSTYEENSKKKALFYAKLSGLPVISDDGGLEIAALGGKPGIHSRRWLGYEASDAILIEHMKQVAKDLPNENRHASFVTVVTFGLPSGATWSEKGIVAGVIAEKPNLQFLKGYPYRSFFYLPELKKYYHESELTSKEEKEYNHRWKAVNKLKSVIRKELRLV